MSAVDAVRNPQGIFINTQCFREEAIAFAKNGYYTPEPTESLGWIEYWEEQERRCINGYSVGGVHITGHHYHYLNFNQIQLTTGKGEGLTEQVVKRRKAQKKSLFPDFWDGDYNYYHSLNIAEHGCTEQQYKDLGLVVSIDPKYLTGGYHMIVGKARRKGYSYKNSAICANIYNTVTDSTVVIGAYLKSYLYPDGTMGKASECLEFLNTHTGWAKARQFVSRPEHKKASYREATSEGIEVERGFRSQIIAVTFQNNPDAARGKDGQLILFEEAGKFDNLKDSYLATKDTLEDGIYTTGMMVIFGTGGDMEGGTVDFAEMFMNPLTYDLMPFINIWDEKAGRTMCGYFHPDALNLVGCYDEQGNSDIKKAENFEESKRDQLRRQANSSTALQQRKQEHANNPSDAFLTVSTNDFPIVELNRRLQYLRQENLHLKLGQPGTLYQDENGKAKFKLDLEDKNKPLWDYDIKETDHTGSVVIFEYPISDSPTGLYKIGHDPYRHDTASTSVSLGATYIYKGIMQGSVTRNIIVASYIGRPSTSNDYNRNLMLLAELYNAQIGYENEVTEVKSYFEKKNKLHLLAVQPDHVIRANIKDSNVARVYGIHMPEKLKDAGEKYIKQWLLTERDFDENGNKILNLDTIPDPGLLEELIKYNRKGNFDRVMAFMILMMFIEEETEGYEHKKVAEANVDYFNLNKKLFRRQ